MQTPFSPPHYNVSSVVPGVGALAEGAGVGPVAGVEALVADEAALVPELLGAEGAGEEVAAALALAVLVLVTVPVALAAARAETHCKLCM